MATFEDLYAENFDDGNEALDDDQQSIQEAEEAPVENTSNNEPDQSSSKQVKPKRIIRNPQPKLNADTLRSKRGLIALPTYFDRVKYKGKGYEQQDLTAILKTYEYWCHRLFPRYPFDECITRIEKLGKKKPVQVQVKKIRLDMVHDEEAILLNNIESDEEENLNDNIDNIFNDIPIEQIPVEISEEQQEQIRINREKAEKIRQEKLRRAQEQNTFPLDETSSQVSIISALPDTQASTSQIKIFSPEMSSELTEEQKERIRLNKEKAEKLRQERVKRKEVQDSLSSESSNIVNDPISPGPNQSSSDKIESLSCTESYENVDDIFNKIQRFNGQEQLNNARNCSLDIAEIPNTIEESNNEDQISVPHGNIIGKS